MIVYFILAAFISVLIVAESIRYFFAGGKRRGRMIRRAYLRKNFPGLRVKRSWFK